MIDRPVLHAHAAAPLVLLVLPESMFTFRFTDGAVPEWQPAPACLPGAWHNSCALIPPKCRRISSLCIAHARLAGWIRLFAHAPRGTSALAADS